VDGGVSFLSDTGRPHGRRWPPAGGFVVWDF
jgi:hypothetical protein